MTSLNTQPLPSTRLQHFSSTRTSCSTRTITTPFSYDRFPNTLVTRASQVEHLLARRTRACIGNLLKQSSRCVPAGTSVSAGSSTAIAICWLVAELPCYMFRGSCLGCAQSLRSIQRECKQVSPEMSMQGGLEKEHYVKTMPILACLYSSVSSESAVMKAPCLWNPSPVTLSAGTE